MKSRTPGVSRVCSEVRLRSCDRGPPFSTPRFEILLIERLTSAASVSSSCAHHASAYIQSRGRIVVADWMTPVDILESRIGRVTVLTVAGRLVLGDGDAALHERIEALAREGRIDIVLNVHDASYVDSCGVGVMVQEYVSLRRRGGTLKLVCPSQRCHRMLTITHLTAILELYESDEAALRSYVAETRTA